MARVLVTYGTTLLTPEGVTYRARACGRERDDGTWEGWFEFLPDDGSEILRSARETTQPNLVDLEYWATGVTPVYLEGALERALVGPLEVTPPPPVQQPAYDEPAPAVVAAPDPLLVTEPVLDPFAVYAQGEMSLRRHLDALDPRHLRQIVRSYELAMPDIDLEAMTPTELVALIVTAVRDRLAA